MTAATSAWASVSGPSCAICDAERPWPATRINATVPTSPAMAQTSVDTSFGLIAESLARSGLSAEAWTVRPTVVRLRNHANAIAIMGTTTMTESWAPVTWMPARVHVPETATGYPVYVEPVLGKAEATARASSAIPMVATRTMTLGELNSLRITAISTRTANIVPTRSAKGAATQKGVW